jgi:hypothetical protein
MDDPKPLELSPEMEKERIDLLKEKFGLREVDPNSGVYSDPFFDTKKRTTRKAHEPPVVKLFRCQGENPGCGAAKPASEFYKETQTLCAQCCLALVRKHATDLYWVPLILNCYDITRNIAAEAKTLATPEGRELARIRLVVDRGIEKGRNHFVKSMIEGTRRAPMESVWVTELYDRYRGWIMTQYDVPPEKYSNLPKNGLLR